MEYEVIINFLLAAGIGAVIGIERERVDQKNKITGFAGIRTFILISIFSFLLAHIAINVLNSTAIFLVGFVMFMIFVAIAYAILAVKTKRVGATTPIATIIVFMLSAIVSIDATQNLRLTAIIIAVIVAALLALKENLHNFAKNIKTKEMFAAIEFAIISAVILPILPNKAYSPLEIPVVRDIISAFPKIIPIAEQIDVLNPFKIWMVVVLISGLGFAGYILTRIFGEKKGIGLSGFLGGLVSSTAVTVSLSQKSRETKIFRTLAFGIILASSVMFLRVLIVVSAVNTSLLKLVIVPIGAMALTGFIAALIISKSRDKKGREEHNLALQNPFSLKPALKFGIFFMFILLVSKILYILFGNSGIYAASLLSGLADVDAITVTASGLAASKTISSQAAALAITLAVSANTLVKAAITQVMGEKKLAKIILVVFAIVLAVGLSLAFLI